MLIQSSFENLILKVIYYDNLQPFIKSFMSFIHVRVECFFVVLFISTHI